MISLPVEHRFYTIKQTENLTLLLLMTNTVPELVEEFKKESTAIACCKSLNESSSLLKEAYIKVDSL